MFYGRECPHCHEMLPLVKQLEKEEKLKAAKLEVWHSRKNAALQIELGKGKCVAVPFFFNEKTGESICGAVSYAQLRKWAKT